MNNEQNFPNCMRAVTIICESTLSTTVLALSRASALALAARSDPDIDYFRNDDVTSIRRASIRSTISMEPLRENERCAVHLVDPPENGGEGEDDKIPLLEDSGEPPDQIWSSQERELADQEHQEAQKLDSEEVKK